MNPTVHTSDPTDAVERSFRRVETERMADVPILNPVLRVEAVDFQRWQQHWLGVLVTPWCMGLLLLPGSEQGWSRAGANQRRFVQFPAGQFAFLDSEEEGLGHFQSCSLFSPMGAFSSQSQATQTARAALFALMVAPPDTTAAAQGGGTESMDTPVAPRAHAAAPARSPEPAHSGLSRRGFFSLRRS